MTTDNCLSLDESWQIFSVSLTTILQNGIRVPTFMVKKLRLKGVKYLAQYHMAGKVRVLILPSPKIKALSASYYKSCLKQREGFQFSDHKETPSKSDPEVPERLQETLRL